MAFQGGPQQVLRINRAPGAITRFSGGPARAGNYRRLAQRVTGVASTGPQDAQYATLASQAANTSKGQVSNAGLQQAQLAALAAANRPTSSGQAFNRDPQAAQFAQQKAAFQDRLASGPHVNGLPVVHSLGGVKNAQGYSRAYGAVKSGRAIFRPLNGRRIIGGG